MSPPDTNLEKQERRHKGPLIGMAAALAIAVLAFLGVLAWTDYFGETPDEPVDNGITQPAGATAE